MALGDIYVVNANNSTIQAIDPTSNTLRGTAVSIGTSPRGAVWCPANQRIYVASANTARLIAFDPSTNTTGTAIAVGTSPLAACWVPSVSRIYVPNSGATTVSVVNPYTNTVAATISGFGTQPWGAAYAASTGKVWVSCNGATRLDEVNPATNARTGTTVTLTGKAREFVYWPKTGYLYVPVSPASGTAYQVDVVDPVGGTVVTSIGGAPQATPGVAAYAPNSSYVWVGNNGGSVAFAINAEGNTFVGNVGSWGTATPAQGIAYSDISGSLYFATADSNTVRVVDPATNAITATITGLNYGWGVVRAGELRNPSVTARTQAVNRAAVY